MPVAGGRAAVHVDQRIHDLMNHERSGLGTREKRDTWFAAAGFCGGYFAPNR